LDELTTLDLEEDHRKIVDGIEGELERREFIGFLHATKDAGSRPIRLTFRKRRRCSFAGQFVDLSENVLSSIVLPNQQLAM